MKNALADDLKLTDAEKRLLKVMVNPENFDKPVTEICKLADISSTTTYYKAIKKPHFIREYKRQSAALVDKDIADVVKALLREAKKGSFQHIKLALEMAGMYSNQVNINKKEVSISLNGKDLDKLTDEELLELAHDYGVVEDDIVVIEGDDDEEED